MLEIPSFILVHCLQITIYTSPGCVSYNQPRAPNGGDWTTADLLEVSQLYQCCCCCVVLWFSVLQEFSYNDWRPYCLAHLFTNQEFESNELGLAYVASSSPSLQGGICSRCQFACTVPYSGKVWQVESLANLVNRL